MTRLHSIFAALVVTVAIGFTAGSAQAQTVFAAASLKTALDAISAQWEKETGKKPTISYAASPALARQIEGAAPSDVFISADLDWMDYLAERKLIKPDTRGNLLGNRIVLVAPKDSKVALTIGPNAPIAQALGADGKLSMANTDAVPAGKYGKAALEALGVWPSVSTRVAQAADVRAALTMVSRGEAPLGIVYQTDAAADPNVKIVGMFPENAHPAIIYPIAVTANSTHPDALNFVRYLASPAARPLWEKHGFSVMQMRVSPAS